MDNKEGPNIVEMQAGDRHGKWKVEVPKTMEKFVPMLKELVPLALQEVHPALRRMDVTVSFVENILDTKGTNDETHRATGRALWRPPTQKYPVLDIIVSLAGIKRSTPENMRSFEAVQIVLHEFFETDYWLKSRRLKEFPAHASLNDEDYRAAEHESITDSRVAVLLQKGLGLDVNIQPTHIDMDIPHELESKIKD